MKEINGDFILKGDTVIKDDLKVNGNIIGQEFDLKVCGNIDCGNINCEDINCKDINCRNIDCWDINCRNINCLNIDCWGIDCENISFFAFCIAYNSFKCISAKARRENFILKCLDQEIEYKPKEETK